MSNYVQRRRRAAFVTAGLVLVLVIAWWDRRPGIQGAFPGWKTYIADATDAHHDGANSGTALGLAPDYNLTPYETPLCAERFGHQYLEKFRDNAVGYCSPDSPSNLTCFHGRTSSSSPMDSFCIARSAVFDTTDRKFRLDCRLRTLTEDEQSAGIPKVDALRSYWYKTGPGFIFNSAIRTNPDVSATKSTPNFTLLIKREGKPVRHNTWHCLMEIWSYTMTMDILRMTMESATKTPFYNIADVENTRIVFLDDEEDGPYFDLWSLFAKRQPIRLKDLPQSTELENIIVPLPGATNPLWSGDWEVHSCEHSDLLRAFSHRVINFYKVDAWAPHSGDLTLTFIDRKGSRQLVGVGEYLKELQEKYPHVKVQTIDFGAHSFGEQIRIVCGTDILVGVHGAGLTHGMFLREGSVMAEMLPETLNHKGFRNLAGLMGHSFFSLHATEVPANASPPTKFKSRAEKWQTENVFVEKERFMDLMDVAIKTLYNKGLRNMDIA